MLGLTKDPRKTAPNAAFLFLIVTLIAAAVLPASDAWSRPASSVVVAGGPAAEAAPEAAPAPTTSPEKKATSPEPASSEPAKRGGFLGWLEQVAPILILLIVVAIVIGRLPKVELGHTDAFRRRRLLNWLPLGLTYAFLYMGRYNLEVAKLALGDLMTPADFSAIFGAGTVVYGVSFVINGPLTDRIGGQKAILIGAAGAAIVNILMGCVIHFEYTSNLVPLFSVLYSCNMYFQSFGAVAIVKVNASWFHVRERGVFGAIFGILISLGIYFAFDWNKLIVDNLSTKWCFFAPAILLGIFWVLDVIWVRDTPGQAGHRDFDTADASSGDDGPRLGVKEVFLKMLRSPVVMTIALIEFCSGFLRQAIMQYYRMFTKAIGETDGFVYQNWGLLLCCAGILGGVVAGVISDRVFQSRRGPVSAVLYGGLLAGAVAAIFLLGSPLLGWLVVAMSVCVIGVHGMLSGTASMDFGGRKNVGIAVGIIDGFVYLGTGFMSIVYFYSLPKGEEARLEPSNWIAWPVAMVPMALIGLVLASRIWKAMPTKAAARPAEPKAAAD